MAGAFLKLYWHNWWTQWRRASSGMVVAGVAVTFFAVVIGVLLVGSVWAARSGVEAHAAMWTFAGAILMLAWVFLPVLVFGTDAFLDPSRFALFPVRARDLMPGLALVGLLGQGGLFTAAILGAGALSWTSGAGLVAALVGAVVGWLSCVVFSRWVTSALASALNSKRFKDLATVVMMLLTAAGVIGLQVVSGAQGQVSLSRSSAALRTAEILGWTPLGWCWMLPADAVAGRWGLAAARLVLALALLALAGWGWSRSVAAALVNPTPSAHGAGRRGGGGLVERMVPPTPAGAIAGRMLRYFRRDPRMVALVVSGLIGPVAMVVPLLVGSEGGDRSVLTVTLPAVLGFFVPLQVAQLISYDGTALWLQIQAGTRGCDDRWGRAMAFLWVFTPIYLLAEVALGWWTGSWALGGLAMVAVVGSLLVACGVGSWVGARRQVPVAEAGSNGLSGMGSGGATGGCLMALLAMPLSLLVTAPVVAPLALFWYTSSPLWAVVSVVVSLAWGGLVCWWGVVRGGRVIERDWAKVLAGLTASGS